MSQKERRAKWKTLIASYEARGNQTANQWCQDHGVNPRQLWYWLRKFKHEGTESSDPSTDWVSVELNTSFQQKPTVGTSADSLLLKVGPATIKVKPGYNAELLADVVRTLKSC